MRKILIVVCGLLLALTSLSPASAAELTGGQKDIGLRDQATNGSVHAVVWGKRVNDDSSKVWISYKRGSSAWTDKQSLATLDFTPFASPQVTVTESGLILVAWLDEEVIKYRELLAGETNWQSAIDVPDSSVTGQWFNDLDMVSNGESVTIAGVRSLSDSLQYVTWTRTDEYSPFTFENVASAVNTNVFGSCKKSTPEECNYRVSELHLVTNEAGNQVFSWMTFRETGGWKAEMKNATFGIFVARRSAPEDDWSSPVKIDSLNFKAKVDFYAYFIGSTVLTEGGKAAISWMSGYNKNPVKVFASISQPGATAFVASDKSVLSKAYEANRIKLAAVGENIWAAYEFYAKSGADFVVKVGKLGDLANAKNWASGDYYFHEITSDGSNPVMIGSGDGAGSSRKVYKSVRNGANWTAPTAIMTLDNSASYVSDVFYASAGGAVVITATGSSNTVWNIGLEATIL
jgi:hypothetical protein